MATIFWMNMEIACGMVCFFHQKKHSYLIVFIRKFWKYTGVCQSQTDTAAQSVSVLFYSTVAGKSHDQSFDKSW
jgi:hypothetical protein